MHHLALNLPDIMVKLFRGSFERKKPDKVEQWPWAVFHPIDDDSAWINHSEAVADMRFYIPRSFGKAPRNIAAKMNSGFKAWEHMYHFYMVLPGQLWGVLNDELFEHYCKLVAGCHFALMLETPVALRLLAHKLLVEFVEDFERLYYARQLDRLHFCRHSIHLLVHLIPEGVRRGPLWLFSQWEAALYVMFPVLAKPEGLPKDAVVLGDDYGRVLASAPRGRHERAALLSFLHAHDVAVPEGWELGLWKWARLQLPNGQITRMAFGECKREARNVPIRRACMVKARGLHMFGPFILIHLNPPAAWRHFAEVLYFFRMTMTGADGQDETRVLAMVSEFTLPDPTIAKDTHNVLMVCYSQGAHPPRVVDVKDVVSVVAMMPLGPRPCEAHEPDAERRYADHYYVWEKLGCDMAWIGRGDNPNYEEEEEDENWLIL
ncbi:hypothetical protein OH76DRAFT_1459606 [Lentinus brumalis]|uniref:Uncharacterized protein n=1 Tax=Lentinus brumalis TaxID=2498619 RepID=A0A371CIB3_9APHY|nr:hypothetical protein OH76DRAFT_1459606 [Polyporus brumalis]